MANRSRTWDLYGRVSSPLNRRLWLLFSLQLTLILVGSFYACGSVFRRANTLGRRCLPLSGRVSVTGIPKLKIAMVSLSEERKGGKRNFQGLMELVRRNKKAYAEKGGYEFIDSSNLIDHSRPPSWSKILAVRSCLRNYDWVFWNDADTLVTNSSISLENILQSVIGDSDFESSPDLILTEDVTGVNAGTFFVRRSNWSQEFLDTWWNQTSFVRFGSSKSGDNDALKNLISVLPSDALAKHVRISPMQCLFNSYPWFPSWKTAYRLVTSPSIIWKGTYSNGDFMVHLAGLDEKRRWAAEILREIPEDG
ncbi:alpha-1,2-galactosyltransferase gmh3-like [Aristolochia californica]|uniref:alpha-1,2-galactosyltransferase gmh3-like n=1 Tax=Aristolochia californica TaxID=171875 RepID=UPI0035DA824F